MPGVEGGLGDGRFGSAGGVPVALLRTATVECGLIVVECGLIPVECGLMFVGNGNTC